MARQMDIRKRLHDASSGPLKSKAFSSQVELRGQKTMAVIWQTTTTSHVHASL